MKIGYDKAIGYKYIWDGVKKIYLHRHIMSQHLGRELDENEFVHHIDGDKTNNDIKNLQIVTNSQHAKIHAVERTIASGYRPRKATKCAICGSLTKHDKYCSIECYRQARKSKIMPSLDELSKDIENMSWVAIGKKYGVSDNAVRKWARKYGIL